MDNTNNQTESSVSSYVTEAYEGFDTAFSEVSQVSSRGYCDIYRAKRYGRWYLLKCLKAEHRDDAAHQQMLRKEVEVLMRLQHPGVMQALGMETVTLPGEAKPVQAIVAEWIDGVTLKEYLNTPPLTPAMHGEGSGGGPSLKQLRRR